MKLCDPVSRSQGQLVRELDREIVSKADHHLVCLHCTGWGIAQQGQGGRGEEPFTRVRLEFVRLDVPIKGNDYFVEILCKSCACGCRGWGGEGGLLHRQSGIAHLGVGKCLELVSQVILYLTAVEEATRTSPNWKTPPPIGSKVPQSTTLSRSEPTPTILESRIKPPSRVVAFLVKSCHRVIFAS